MKEGLDGLPGSANGVCAATRGPTRAAMGADNFIICAMRECLPDDVPLSFAVVSARWMRKGAQRRAVAEVVMFDGAPATLEVWTWSSEGGHAHMWKSMTGGDATFEVGRWVRVSDGDAKQSSTRPTDGEDSLGIAPNPNPQDQAA